MTPSPSSRGRGLKFLYTVYDLFACAVALFTRAWIEIVFTLDKVKSTNVALFTRAWIEINFFNFAVTQENQSPSSRGRGLKCNIRAVC